MMNQHLPAGPGHIPPAIPLHPVASRRQQEYHTFHHQQLPPQSPVHPHYTNYHHQQPYYPHSSQQTQYPPPQRWQQGIQYHPPQQYLPPPPQQQYQPLSPLVVTSQPHAQPLTPVTRQSSYPPPPQRMQSPRPTPQRMPSQVSAAPPSPAPTPKQVTAPPPPPPTMRESTAVHPLSLSPVTRMPKYPELPWYSPNATTHFPPRANRRRRTRQTLQVSNEAVALPNRKAPEDQAVVEPPAEDATSETSTIAARSEQETPATSQAPSESELTNVSTPATPSRAQQAEPEMKSSPSQTTSPQTRTHARRDTRTAVPILPVATTVGAIQPKTATSSPSAPERSPPPPTNELTSTERNPAREQESELAEAPQKTEEPAPKTVPKSWADLVRSKNPPATSINAIMNGTALTNGASLPRSAPLADALKQYSVARKDRVAFLEPRGLVNTGNMCYMNSILQVLVFCGPFYQFLDQVSKRAAHSFKNDTPLIDAMILFMKEFKVLDTAENAQQLPSHANGQALEQYGEPVTPEYVYDVIRKLPRFSSMRRGHQQDAEEFLGFLLEGLHDECVTVMRGQSESNGVEVKGIPSPTSVTSPISGEAGWLEVGPKQKAAITRQSGHSNAPSPVTKIFGGNLRSELHVPGLKVSVTLEPYQPLQLDIGAQHVSNIIDALKGLTRSESLTGDFGGRVNTAKKQVFIDTLPPVLILHLKRFQYDNTGSGTQKIWKKVGYPLELEIPKEIFPPAKRGGLAVKGGAPRYRLTSVVYHHGKSAAGGHYTVDVLRQDRRDWVRLDDTVIRRIRPEDVAEGGAEEDPKLLAKALEQHKADQELQKQRKQFNGLDEAERQPEEEKPWSEVNGHAPNGVKKWSAAVATATNGTATPTSTGGRKTPTARKEAVRDNKVAYILLYERM